MLRLDLTALLEQKKISKYKVCKDLGISRTNLNHYCNNDLKRWDIDVLDRLLKYLNCDITDLIQSDEPLNKKDYGSKLTDTEQKASDAILTDREQLCSYSGMIDDMHWSLFDIADEIDSYCEKNPNPKLYEEYYINDQINRLYQISDELEDIACSFPDYEEDAQIKNRQNDLPV